MAAGPLLAGLGSVVFQVIAHGEVFNWAGVFIVAATVAFVTAYFQWPAVTQLWRRQD
jgi:hypothetical protein